ncbi:MAG: transporter [Deltaproteobacteria bacterium]|nr:transporter [Deltaproteobacteria bacterium]
MAKTMLKIILIAVFLVTAQLGVSEANDRARYQKIKTESASVVESGKFEIDLSYMLIDQIGKQSGAFSNSFGTTSQDRSKMRYHQAMLAVTYGLMDKMDITARIGWADIKDREYPFADSHGNGITDLEIETKYVFYQDDENGVKLAYVAGLEVPIAKASRTGKLRIGQNFWSFNQQLVLTKDLNEDWTMNADVGYQLPFGRTRDAYSPRFGRRMADTRGTLESNVAFGYTGIDFLQPVVEANYAHEWLDSASDFDLLGFTVGAIVPLDKHRLRIGVQRDFWGRNAVNAYTWTAGFTMAF